jgi:tripartite-type tricarboxylate transporter receptor subunit TctC
MPKREEKMKMALRSLVVFVLVLLSGAAPAETWPTRPIKFVVPFGPGIGIDIMARTVADRLSHKLGQPVIVENIPGAGNILGAQAVARAAPDGYTLLFTGPSPVVTNIFAFKSLPYDPYRDFTGVAMISDRGPFVIAVNPKLPVSTLPELLAYARARPGQLHYAIDGSAIFQSVVARSFAKAADVDLVEVGYRTTSQALQDTVAGFTEMVFSSVAASSGLAEQGKLKRIAITSKTRFPGVEELPTVGETLPGYSFEGYIPLLAPAGLPGDIAERINRKIDEVLREPEVLARFQTFGYATSGADTPEGVNEHIRADRERWRALATELKLEPK